ncbi:hypothetical protein F5X96DRAFT_641035 [Biscogniauxia mediterranea]|nr:hypothetical protein F5X96DRAFT_641035 [Biscogniauxia mediterranea]
MHTLETSPAFQYLASPTYRIKELDSLGNGQFRYPFDKLPEVLKNLIRKYNEDEIPVALRTFAEKRGFRIGPVTLGPDLLWINRGNFPTLTPKSRCHVLLAVSAPIHDGEQAENTPSKTRLAVQTSGDDSDNVEVDWHIGHIYLLEENEIVRVLEGGFAFVGIQYATKPVSP